MSHHSSRFAGFLIALSAASAACGGGSDDDVSGLACGPGTHEQAGACLPDGAGGSAAGTGGSASTGGTASGGAGASAAGAAGSAGTGGALAGAGGAAAGAGGAAAGAGGAAAGAGGAASGAGGVAGGAGASGTGGAGAGGGGAAGASGAAGSGGATGLPDDPCPSEPVIDFNASDTCGGTKPADLKVCVDQYAATLAGSDHPFVIRTPSHPGVGAGCKAYCNWGYAWVESFKLKPGLTSTKKYYRVTGGGKGWQWYFAGFAETCPTQAPTVGCESSWTTNPEPRLVIFTTDPDAPSVNIRVEVSTQPFSCP